MTVPLLSPLIIVFSLDSPIKEILFVFGKIKFSKYSPSLTKIESFSIASFKASCILL